MTGHNPNGTLSAVQMGCQCAIKTTLESATSAHGKEINEMAVMRSADTGLTCTLVFSNLGKIIEEFLFVFFGGDSKTSHAIMLVDMMNHLGFSE